VLDKRSSESRIAIKAKTSLRVKAKTPKPKKWWDAAPRQIVHSSRSGEVVRSDALEALTNLSDASVDLVFLDPPFNLGKDYGANGKSGDRLAEQDYQQYMVRILDQAIRVMKPSAALYLYHIPRWAFRFAALLDESLSFRHWIAISMKNGFVRGDGLYPAHYALLYFTKGTPAVSKRPKIAPPTCPHCDEYIKDYGGYAQHVEKGINLSDVWDDLSPVRHAKYKNRVANELPMKLVSRVMEISGVDGGVLLDPFAGTGTSVMAARANKMRFIAIDRELDNCELIGERLGRIKARRAGSRREI
jgi:site-specific DNA-methyltransferase (adenine-specific)